MNTSLIDKKITKIMTFIMFFCMVYFLLGATSSFAASSGGSDSVITKIRDVAVNVIEHVKVIAYILGGFGLIGLAWGAIFGKINWKWFGGLSIGLFLISYMGMTIDYFTGKSNHAAKAFKITGIDASNFKDTISSKKPNASSIEINTLITRSKNVKVTSKEVWGDDIFHEEEDRKVIAKIEALAGKKWQDTKDKGKDAVATEIKELAGLKMRTTEEVWGDDIFYEEEDGKVIAKIEALAGKKYKDTKDNGKDAVATEIKELAGLKMRTTEEVWDDQIFHDEKDENTLETIKDIAGVTWQDTKDKKEGASTEIMDVLKKQWEDTLKVEDASSGGSSDSSGGSSDSSGGSSDSSGGSSDNSGGSSDSSGGSSDKAGGTSAGSGNTPDTTGGATTNSK